MTLRPAALGLACFLSGAAALVFEGLWFHAAGLTLGNSVWASSLVMAAFMAGLATGSALAARQRSVANPLHFLAALEATIGLTGVIVVFVLPMATPLLLPVLTPLLDQPVLLNGLRLFVALLVMIVPATAMGATLPLVVTAVGRGEREFGRVLGWLYGVNTLGGVTGVLLGEVALIPALGVRGAAVAAALLNVAAAAIALALSRGAAPEASTVTDGGSVSPPRPQGPVLAAAALSGALLLALEVVWFRFLLLFVLGTSLAFAMMLAVVLIGIGTGGLVASAWLRRDPEADRWLSALALLAGTATVVTFAAFGPGTLPPHLPTTGFLLAARLMMPVAFLSGLLFTLAGAAIRRGARGEAQAVGRLALANTLGAMVGALLGGFVLLPRLGIEISLFALAVGYGLVALFVWSGARPRLSRRAVYAAASLAAVFALCASLFPFGLVRNTWIQRLIGDAGQLVAFREGVTDTIAYVRNDWGGEPRLYRLLTNGHAMSATNLRSQRYMKLYVYWALAMNPEARKALLICYGVGNTAKALTDTRSLESIDVVDLSADILALSAVPYPPPEQSPLTDPRVRVHVEDGRFFLSTRGPRYDLITAEPPPPKNAGVVNLYSREYFDLIHERLTEGGVATYWLPANQLLLHETQAIIQAFCGAFPDCSLWSGGASEWMLAGSRNGRGPGSVEAFERQWQDPAVASELRKLALDVPDTLAALFIADAPQLAAWARGVLPLEDGWPRRLSSELYLVENVDARRGFADAVPSRARFAESAWIQKMLPLEIRERSLPFFAYRKILDDVGYNLPVPGGLETLRALLRDSPLKALPLQLMGSDAVRTGVAQRAYAAGSRDPTFLFHVAVDHLARREYAAAVRSFDSVLAAVPGFEQARLYRAIALDLSAAR